MAADGRSGGDATGNASAGLRMHPYLRGTIERLVARFSVESWCVGMYLSGSGGSGTDDEWSDVDLDLVVEDGAYAEVAAGLRAICEAECGAIRVWLPEGERPGQYCNYAFLFEANGEQFLYDFILLSRSFLQSPAQEQRRPGKVLLDREGLLARLKETRAPRPYHPDAVERPHQLAYAIDAYWTYAYLNGKYWRRQDLYKLLYVQQVLFATHLRVLRASNPEGEWGWWPRDITRLPPVTQQALLRYFCPPDAEVIRTALGSELTQFGADARAACERWDRPYPEDVERYVRLHLIDAGVLEC